MGASSQSCSIDSSDQVVLIVSLLRFTSGTVAPLRIIAPRLVRTQDSRHAGKSMIEPLRSRYLHRLVIYKSRKTGSTGEQHDNRRHPSGQPLMLRVNMCEHQQQQRQQQQQASKKAVLLLYLGGCLTLVFFGMPNPRRLLAPAPTMLSPSSRGIRAGGGGGSVVAAVGVNSDAEADADDAASTPRRRRLQQQQLRAATETGTNTNSLGVGNLSSGRIREPECCLPSCPPDRRSNA